MAISVSIKTFNKRKYVYIVDSFRDPLTRKPTSRVLESYGNMDKLLAKKPDAMKEIEKRAEELRTNSASYGKAIQRNLGKAVAVSQDPDGLNPNYSCLPAIYYPVWKKLGLERYLRNAQHNFQLPYDLEKTVFFSCVSRLAHPESRRASWLGRDRFLFDFNEIGLKELYGCLDELSSRKNRLIERMNTAIDKLYKRDLTVAMYDVTTFYFESFTEDDLRSRGMSKEHRTQETQVVLGLLVDSQGIPLTYELFKGNTAEVGTLMEVVTHFRKQYSLDSVTVIADSGLNQLINLQALSDAGFNYIVGYPPYVKLSKKDQEKLLSEEGWICGSHGQDNWKYKSMDLHIDKSVRSKQSKKPLRVELDARCVCTFSEKRHSHDVEELQSKYKKAGDLVARGQSAVKAANRSGYKAFIECGTENVRLNRQLYERRLKWCGYMALLTNLKDVGEEELYGKLRQLWRIEDNFRVLKTNLQARPVFVWTKEHIRGHFVLNYIGLVMQKILMRILREKGLNLSSGEIIRSVESIRITRLRGLKKASSNLYNCSSDQTLSLSQTDEKGQPRRYSDIAQDIFKAVGIEPLNGLETPESLKRKFGMKIPMK